MLISVITLLGITWSLAFCVCSVVLFSCKEAVCLWTAIIWACRLEFWVSSCLSWLLRATFSACSVAFWEKQKHYRYKRILWLKKICTTISINIVWTYISLNLNESIFDLEQLPGGFMALFLPFAYRWMVLSTSRGRGLHHFLLLLPLTQCFIVFLHLNAHRWA